MRLARRNNHSLTQPSLFSRRGLTDVAHIQFGSVVEACPTQHLLTHPFRFRRRCLHDSILAYASSLLHSLLLARLYIASITRIYIIIYFGSTVVACPIEFCRYCRSAAIAPFDSHSMDCSPSKIETALVNFARTRLEYFSCCFSMSMSPDAVTSAATGVTQAFKQQLHIIPSVGYATGLELLSMINESTLPAANIEVLVNLINSKVGATESRVSETKQECSYFHEYLRAGNTITESIFNDTSDTHVRLRGIAKFARMVGINYPSEDTKAKMTACAFPGLSFAEKMQMAGPIGYEALQLFRRFFSESPIVNPGRTHSVFPSFDNLDHDTIVAAGLEHCIGQSPFFDVQTIRHNRARQRHLETEHK